MTDTSIDLSGKVDAGREQAPRDAASTCDALGIPFFLVGTFAHDLLLELRHGLISRHSVQSPGHEPRNTSSPKVEAWA
jgi:hypothetical protein